MAHVTPPEPMNLVPTAAGRICAGPPACQGPQAALNHISGSIQALDLDLIGGTETRIQSVVAKQAGFPAVGALEKKVPPVGDRRKGGQPEAVADVGLLQGDGGPPLETTEQSSHESDILPEPPGQPNRLVGLPRNP